MPARHQVPDAPAPQPIIIIQQPAVPTLRIENPPPPTAPSPAGDANAIRETDNGPGRVYVLVDPPAAEVYLDDDYLGTGETLGQAMELTAGVHVLEVEHPDYPPEQLVFSLSTADEILVEVDLEGDRRGHKSRIRTAGEVEARLRLLGR